MLRFCNYLRGVDDEQTSQLYADNRALSAEKSKWFKMFLKYFLKMFKLLFPKFICSSTILFFVLLLSVIAIEFVIYQVGLLGGKFYKTLSNRDSENFKSLAVFSIFLIIINAVMKSLNDFMASLLSIIWRKNITLKLHDLYFSKRNFYYLQFYGSKTSSNQQKIRNLANNVVNVLSDSEVNTSIPSTAILMGSSAPSHNTTSNNDKAGEIQILDNPDQRITQDVKSLCDSISTIVPLLMITPFVIGWYGYQTFQTVGYMGPLAVVAYFIIWSLINGPLTNPLAKVVYVQDKREGDFRFKHMNIRTNAESIAFYNSGQNELHSLNNTFKYLLNISYKRNWKEFILNVFVNTSQYMGGIVSYLVLAIPIFTNIYAEETPAELAQLITSYSFKCQYLIYFFTRLYNILNEVSIIAGNSHRVGELIDQMQYANENSNKPKHVGAIENEICLNVKNLNVMIPDNSKCLVKNLNMIFKRNENILITGRSGCGKTSLFRCLSGLWKSYNGQIIINDQQAKYLFFLPQNSYFPSGSLIDQITYPSVLIGNQLTINESVQDEILSWLNKFNLEHLLSLVKNDLFHQASFNWSSVLSAGEKQRLSFLRVLYHKPKYALLDEFTSSVDQETETTMYESLQEIQCTFMSIAHRDTVRKYHQKELQILKDSTCKLIDLF